MASSKTLRIPTPIEERLNMLSHALGLLLSVLGFVLLFTWHESPLPSSKVAILGVFGLSLIALYLASTLYHASKDEQRKRFFKYCDHSAIYLLIAGTYTPFLLLGTHGQDGQVMVATVWAMAFAGIIAKFFLVGRFRFVSTLMYLFMGWLAIFEVDLLLALPKGELNWIIAGGLSYSLGTVFYLWHRLPYSHAIWHLFVLGGSACHYLGVLLYVSAA